ncbi:MAG: hypothetical protein ACI4I3_00095, partial [Acutalibacteraceae bacterium]
FLRQQKLHVPQAHFILHFSCAVLGVPMDFNMFLRTAARAVPTICFCYVTDFAVFKVGRGLAPAVLALLNKTLLFGILCRCILFALGELVRRGRRTQRIFRELFRFQSATVGDGSSVPHKNRAVIIMFSRNAEDGVSYEKSLFFNRFGVSNKRREQAPALP